MKDTSHQAKPHKNDCYAASGASRITRKCKDDSSDMYGQGFSGPPVGRGRGAAVPAWMADPALAAQAQTQAHPGAAPPTGFNVSNV